MHVLTRTAPRPRACLPAPAFRTLRVLAFPLVRASFPAYRLPDGEHVHALARTLAVLRACTSARAHFYFVARAYFVCPTFPCDFLRLLMCKSLNAQSSHAASVRVTAGAVSPRGAFPTCLSDCPAQLFGRWQW